MEVGVEVEVAACKGLAAAVGVGWMEEAGEAEEEAVALSGVRLRTLRLAVAPVVLVVAVAMVVGREGQEPPVLQLATRSGRAPCTALDSSSSSSSHNSNCRKGCYQKGWGPHQRKRQKQLLVLMQRGVWGPARTSRKRGGVQERERWALLQPLQLRLSKQQKYPTRVALPVLLVLLVLVQLVVEGWYPGRTRTRSWES